MKTVAAFMLALLSGASASRHLLKKNVRMNMGDDRILSIPHGHMNDKTVNILEQHDADHFGSEDAGFHFRLTPEAVRALEAQNIKFEDATEEWIAQFEANFDDENFMCEADDCAERNMQDFYTQYQALPALHARAINLANGVNFASIGSLGQSYEGRDQLTVNIGDQTKPLVFYFCNIHAREWLTPMYCMYMVETLIADGGHPLLDTFSFTVLISANPDGYVYSTTSDSLWRKTRRPNPGSSCVGTDPNRNYDNRHCGPGTSNNPCSQTFCGPSPWSEIEVANIRDFGLANSDRMIAMNDVHSYSRLWMTPYGGISQNPPNPDFSKQQACNLAAVQGIQAETGGSLWEYGPVYSTIYPAAGVSVDYFYDDIGVIYSMTAELRGTNFQPSPGNIMPSNREVFAALVGSLECVIEQEGLAPTSPPVPGPVPDPTPFPTVPPTAPPTCFWFFC